MVVVVKGKAATREEVETLPLKRVQSELERKPLVVPLACVRVSTPPVKESGPEKLVAMTPPVELVESNEFWTVEIANADVVALVVVALVKMPVEAPLKPIGELFTLPPFMVSASLICESTAVPVRSEKLTPKLEVAKSV